METRVAVEISREPDAVSDFTTQRLSEWSETVVSDEIITARISPATQGINGQQSGFATLRRDASAASQNTRYSAPSWPWRRSRQRNTLLHGWPDKPGQKTSFQHIV